jgi:membrane-associated phospholipid phosphatase
MNHFDAAILGWVNQFAQRSLPFDTAVTALAGMNMAKGGLFVLILVWAWLSNGGSRRRNREVVVATVVAALIAIVLARVSMSAFPFRPRPMHGVDMPFVLPFTATPDFSRSWSAFPSDHAMLFAAFSTGLWFLSPILGLAAHAYSTIFIGMPRLYVGLHHPTDLLAGAAIGIAVRIACNCEPVRRRLSAAPLRWAEESPRASFMLALLLALQIATMFEDARTALRCAGALRKSAASRAARDRADRALGTTPDPPAPPPFAGASVRAPSSPAAAP